MTYPSQNNTTKTVNCDAETAKDLEYLMSRHRYSVSNAIRYSIKIAAELERDYERLLAQKALEKVGDYD